MRKLLAWWKEWWEPKWVEAIHTGMALELNSREELKAALDANGIRYEIRRSIWPLTRLDGNYELILLCRTKRDAMVARLIL